jgi:hypothetical protein
LAAFEVEANPFPFDIHAGAPTPEFEWVPQGESVSLTLDMTRMWRDHAVDFIGSAQSQRAWLFVRRAESSDKVAAVDLGPVQVETTSLSSAYRFPREGLYDLSVCFGAFATECTESDYRKRFVVTAPATALYPEHNDTSRDRINLVFAHAGFGSQSQLLDSIQRAVSLDLRSKFNVVQTQRSNDEATWLFRPGLMQIEPFRKFPSAFNFWVMALPIHAFEERLGTFIETEVRKVGARGPVMRISWTTGRTSGWAVGGTSALINLLESPPEGDIPVNSAPLRVDWENVYDRSTAVLIHELGHAIFGFQDEYLAAPGRRASYPTTLPADSELSWTRWSPYSGLVPPFLKELQGVLQGTGILYDSSIDSEVRFVVDCSAGLQRCGSRHLVEGRRLISATQQSVMRTSSSYVFPLPAIDHMERVLNQFASK